MAIFKCKICGGSLEIANSQSVVECNYCGTKQTLPKLDDETKTNLFDRANHFRRNHEFDKAMSIYEQILIDEQSDAETYWSILLCRYGIEYVEDPVSHKQLPTINRAQKTSIYMDEDYKAAIKNADSYQKEIYQQEASIIDDIQKGIWEISNSESSFDVFICYKEGDNYGRRTVDSVLANDLYHGLTNEGFKVFFSRITLESKLGTAYEPYIFAALNSARVMVVLGTKAEHFNSVWVKNEWIRYLELIKKGENKVLIPAYKDMDPYDLPEEFSHLQAQDMTKLGFMQDLIRGIKKILTFREGGDKKQESSISLQQNNIDPLLRRAKIFLDDEDWENAEKYCEKVLDIEPENSLAYVYKLFKEFNVSSFETLSAKQKTIFASASYKNALRFGNQETVSLLENCNKEINNNIEIKKKWNRAIESLEKSTNMQQIDEIIILLKSQPPNNELTDLLFSKLSEIEKNAKTEQELECALKLIESFAEVTDVSAIRNKCLFEFESLKKEWIYKQAIALKANDKSTQAIELMAKVPGYKDANELLKKFKQDEIDAGTPPFIILLCMGIFTVILALIYTLK